MWILHSWEAIVPTSSLPSNQRDYLLGTGFFFTRNVWLNKRFIIVLTFNNNRSCKLSVYPRHFFFIWVSPQDRRFCRASIHTFLNGYIFTILALSQFYITCGGFSICITHRCSWSLLTFSNLFDTHWSFRFDFSSLSLPRLICAIFIHKFLHFTMFPLGSRVNELSIFLVLLFSKQIWIRFVTWTVIITLLWWSYGCLITLLSWGVWVLVSVPMRGPGFNIVVSVIDFRLSFHPFCLNFPDRVLFTAKGVHNSVPSMSFFALGLFPLFDFVEQLYLVLRVHDLAVGDSQVHQ